MEHFYFDQNLFQLITKDVNACDQFYDYLTKANLNIEFVPIASWYNFLEFCGLGGIQKSFPPITFPPSTIKKIKNHDVSIYKIIKRSRKKYMRKTFKLVNHIVNKYKESLNHTIPHEYTRHLIKSSLGKKISHLKRKNSVYIKSLAIHIFWDRLASSPTPPGVPENVWSQRLLGFWLHDLNLGYLLPVGKIADRLRDMVKLDDEEKAIPKMGLFACDMVDSDLITYCICGFSKNYMLQKPVPVTAFTLDKHAVIGVRLRVATGALRNIEQSYRPLPFTPFPGEIHCLDSLSSKPVSVIRKIEYKTVDSMQS